MNLNKFALIVIMSVLLAGCTTTTKSDTPLNCGVASWYGHKFHGRLTANGERYNQWAATAAHKTLSFGTIVRVENQSNGESTTLRINDRGPFVGNRIIDVSRQAAKDLGFKNAGTTRVCLYEVEQ